MVFVEKGDASQATATLLQLSEKLYEGILVLIKFFLEKQQEQPSESQPELEHEATELSAKAFQATAEKFGSKYLTEDGKNVKAAQVGEYLVITDPTKDAIDYSTYHVYKDGVKVFAFKEDPPSVVDKQAQVKKGEPAPQSSSQKSIAKQYIYHETEGSLSTAQKMQFLQDFEGLVKCNPLDNPDYGQGIAGVQKRLEALGKQAPLGSYAVLVGEQLLRDSGQSQVSGNLYRFTRCEIGAIAISHNGSKEPFCTMAASGKLSTNANFTPTVRVQFQQMHDRLSHIKEQWQSQQPPVDQRIAASGDVTASSSFQLWQQTMVVHTRGQSTTASVSASKQSSASKAASPKDLGGR